MPIISIFSGAFCHGEEVSRLVCSMANLQDISAEVIKRASEKHSVSEAKLARILTGPPPFFNKLTHDREKGIAYLKLALAELLLEDNVLYHGYASQFIPPELTHVLRVCLIANQPYRVQQAMQQLSISEKEAVRVINREDGHRSQWTRLVRNGDPYDEKAYDMRIAMQLTTVEETASMIVNETGKQVLQPNEESRQAAKDFVLAAQVQVALTEKGYDVDVIAEREKVHIALNRYTARLDSMQQKLEDLAMTVPGVKEATSRPGVRFVPPSLIPMPDLESPGKILLVDDEHEFVHTLSERLQTRSLDSTVVYDGEEALALMEDEEPEVMVLDLKMPGIDGLEVLRRVKKKHPEVEVIILTGHGSEKEKNIAMELGAFAYLQKPVGIDLLAETMKKAYQKSGKSPKDG